MTIKIKYNNKKLIGKCGPRPVFACYTLAFALQLRKKHGKTSARIAARTTQVDTVQYKNKIVERTAVTMIIPLGPKYQWLM
jgi:hypothetical protein